MKRFAQAFCALVIFVFSLNAATAESLLVDQRFELEHNRIYVNVQINGQSPFRFMLDTGASGVGRLDIRTVEKLGLKQTGTFENSDGTNTKIEPAYMLDSLQLGALKLEGVELMARDYNKKGGKKKLEEGIIGRGFFEKHLLALDYPNQTIRVSDGALSASDPAVMNYDRPFRVPGQIGSIETNLYLDSGSTLSFHIPIAMMETLKHEPTGKTLKARKAYTTFNLIETKLNEAITLGSVTHAGATGLYSKKAHWVNVGGEFLRNFVYVIDQRNKRVALYSPS